MSSSDEDKRELLELLTALDERKTYHRLLYYRPYPKQRLFHNLGDTKRERLLRAGNRNGKTECCAAEVAYHLTGDYPEWWHGRRFDHAVEGWACGVTGLVTRDVSQEKLCGKPGIESAFGSGYIPRDRFVDKPSLARGITDYYDMVQVRHKSGDVSMLNFKSYDQGREKFQGTGKDFVWWDEEPPEDVYQEGVTRIGEKKGISLMSFTPLKGRSDVVLMFEANDNPDRVMVSMTIDDAEHLDAETKRAMIAGWPAYQRDARARGLPMQGEGRVFTTLEDQIMEAPLEYVPHAWTKLWGIDFGIGHPFAAALMFWDRDSDVMHVHHTIRMADAIPITHVAAMKKIAAGVRVAWPHDGHDREKGSGEPIMQIYKKLGLRMLDQHAQFVDGGYGTEAGVLDMDTYITGGRFKVNASLSDWFDEYRQYHRKDGLIVKERDDLLSATRTGHIVRRLGQAGNIGPSFNQRRHAVIYDDSNDDPWEPY